MNKMYRKDVAIQALVRIIGGGFSFLSIFVLTYIFSEAEIGAYNIILSNISIVVSLFTLWLSQGILRYYHDEADNGFIFWTTIVLGFLCIVVLKLISTCFNQTMTIHIYIYVFFLVFYSIYDSLYRIQRDLSKYASLELLFAVGKVFPLVIIIQWITQIDSIFISQYLMIGIYLLFMVSRKTVFRSFFSSYTRKILQKYFIYGLPLMGMAISNWLLTLSDRYIIMFFDSDISVGIYSINYSLANNIYMMFALILVNAFYPIIIKLWDQEKVEGEKLISCILNYYLMLMIPLVFFGCLKAEVLLNLFKGNLYSQYSDIFIWTSLGIFLYGLSLLYHKYYELTKKTYYILIYNLVVAIINIILNIMLIPKYGFSIAAFTTFISYFIYILLVRISTFKVFRVGFSIRVLLKIIPSIFVFFMIDYYLELPNSFLGFLIEGFFYVLFTAIYYRAFRIINVFSLLKG